MKREEIRVGEDYAVAATGSLAEEYPQRARVLEVGVYGEVRRARGFGTRQSKHANFVRVAYLNRSGEPLTWDGSPEGKPREGTEAAQCLRRTWAEQLKVDEAVAERRQQKEAARREAATRRAEAQRLAKLAGLPGGPPNFAAGPDGAAWALTAGELMSLLKRLADAEAGRTK